MSIPPTWGAAGIGGVQPGILPGGILQNCRNIGHGCQNRQCQAPPATGPAIKKRMTPALSGPPVAKVAQVDHRRRPIAATAAVRRDSGMCGGERIILAMHIANRIEPCHRVTSGRLSKARFQGIAPAGRNLLEIGIIGADAVRDGGLQRVPLVEQQIQRRPDRERLALMVESKLTSKSFTAASKLILRSKARTRIGRPVLRFADLQIRRILARFDEIAFGIDQKQARLAALDLATENQRSR